jgi:aconitate hydratase
LRLPPELHPSNLQLVPGDMIEIDADPGRISPRSSVPITIRRASGETETFGAIAAIETSLEVEILCSSGIIPFILHRATKSDGTSRMAQNPDFTDAGESTRRMASPVLRR